MEVAPLLYDLTEDETMRMLNIYKTRWQSLAAGMLIYLSIGLIYAWSIFVTPLEAEFGWNRSQTSVVFTISVISLAFGSVTGSLLVRRFSSKMSLRIGALAMAFGLVSSTFIESLGGLFFCYGVICGFSVGIVYNVNINTVLRWFPDRSGMASGLLLMCYGMGSMVLGTLSSWIITQFGWRMAFRILAAVFGGLVFLLAKWIIAPPRRVQHVLSLEAAHHLAESDRKRQSGLELTTGQVLRRPSAWLYLLWETVLTASGLGLISHAATISLEVSTSIAAATLLTGMISLANGSGRVCCGMLFDRFPIQNVMMAINGIGIGAMIMLYLAVNWQNHGLLLAGSILFGFIYGGVCTANSEFMRRFYGSEHYAGNLTLTNFAGGISAVLGPMVAGSLQLATGSYALPLLYLLALAAAAFVIQFFIRKP